MAYKLRTAGIAAIYKMARSLRADECRSPDWASWGYPPYPDEEDEAVLAGECVAALADEVVVVFGDENGVGTAHQEMVG